MTNASSSQVGADDVAEAARAQHGPAAPEVLDSPRRRALAADLISEKDCANLIISALLALEAGHTSYKDDCQSC